MKLPFIKKKVFLSWAGSYFAILLCMILASLMVYGYSASALKAQLLNAERISLGNMKNIIDSRLREVEATTAMLAVSDDVRYATHSADPFTGPDTLISFRNCRNLFLEAIASTPYITDIFLYCGKSNVMLSTRYGLNDKSKTPFQYENSFGMTEESFLKMFSQKKIREFIMLSTNPNPEEPKIVLYTPIYQKSNNYEGALIIFLNSEKLKSLSAEIVGEKKADFIVTDKSGNMISLYGKGQTLQGLDIEEILSETDMHEDYGTLILSAKSRRDQWSYIFVADMQDNFKSLKQFRDTTLTVVIAFFLAGACLAIFWSRRNYLPIQQMVMRVSGFGSKTPSTDTNELTFLAESFENLFTENQNYSGLLHRQRDAVCNTIWTRLLKGRLRSLDSVEENFRRQGICFDSDIFAVMLIRVDDFGILYSDAFNEANDMEGCAFMIIQNILEEILDNHPKSFVAEIESMSACIINYGADPEQEGQAVLQAADKLRSILSEHFHMKISISLSKPGHSLFCINECYEQAHEYLEGTRAVYLDCVITSIHDARIKELGEPGGGFLLSRRRLLLNCLLTKDYKTGRKIAKEITELDNREVSSSDEVRMRKFSCVFDYVLALEMIVADRKSEEWNDAYKKIMGIVNSRDLAEYRAVTEQIFDCFERICDGKHTNESDDKIQSILEYIDEHISDCNLSVTDISKYVNYSVSHISRLLQANVGMGTHEYIQNRRIEKAKQLLRETDISVIAISKMVGYNSFRTMNSAFKKVEGITGTQYREQEKNAGKQ